MIALLLSLACVQGSEAEFYAVDYLTPPAGEVLEIGGMDFLSDGRLVVSTRRGQVWIVEEPLAEDPADAKFTLFCEGLWEGLGLDVTDDEIFVLQRGELSKLTDLDGDGVCDRIDTLCNRWGLSGNYHEFAFGLPRDEAGNFYIGLNVSFFEPEWWHGKSSVPYRGWIMRISPDGSIAPVAVGARSPCGLGMNSAGDLFYTDNQGDWMPASPIFHVQEDAFFGHPAGLDWTDEYRATATYASDRIPPPRAAQRANAALWLPYKWSRSPGNLVPDETGGRFGPFEDQLFVAELTNGMVLRCDLEQVRGEYQGAVFLFRQKIGSVARVAFAPDGTLFCGMTNRGWGGLPPADGLARVRWRGGVPMEMASVDLLQDGFEIEFTRPVAADCELTPSNFVLTDYDYDYWWEYGSPERDTRTLEVTRAELSADRKSVLVHANDLRAARCARMVLKDVVAEGGLPLLHDEFNYTINQLPEGDATTEHIAKVVPPPPAKDSDEEGWLRLTYGDATELWEFEGWQLCDVELARDDPARFETKPGVNALVNDRSDSPSDYVSKARLGDGTYQVGFLLPKGGDSGLLIQGTYEVRITDSQPTSEMDTDHCGAIAGLRPPLRNAYAGSGIWHELQVDFQAARFDAAGNKVENARFLEVRLDGQLIHENVELEGSTNGEPEAPLGPFVVRGARTPVAIGNLRFKPTRDRAREDRETPGDWGEWTDVFDGDSLDGWSISDDGTWEVDYGAIIGTGKASHLFSPRGDYADVDIRAEVKISDGGNSGLYFRVAEGPGWPRGYEAQINSSYPDPQKTGSLYSIAPIAVQLVGPDTWFDYHVTCRDVEAGTHILIRVNGVPITDVIDPDRRHRTGHIALQQHHEGSVIEVRKLLAREPAK